MYAVEQQLPGVALVHREEGEREFIGGMPLDVPAQGQQVAAQLVAVQDHPPRLPAAMEKRPQRHRGQHVQAKQEQAQPVRGVGLVDFHAAATMRERVILLVIPERRSDIRDPVPLNIKALQQSHWIPACAGMTKGGGG
ncbi:MAG TPA: hypothetical protein VFQ95_09990 [Rhodanobacteraceae bacterium]|nr:hypothetical protein [Rhodanobacteraceae bacterium]